MNHDDLLQGAGYRLEMNSLALVIDDFGKVENSSVPKTARVLHEFDHLVRMLGTSYGMLRYAFSSLYLHHFLDVFQTLESLETLRSDWQKVAARIPAKMTRATFDSAYFDKQGLGSIYRAQSFRNATRMLDGHALDQNTLGTLAAWSEMLFRLTHSRQCSEDELHTTMQKVWLTPRPDTQLIYIDGKPLRVSDILEYLGIVVEMGYRVQFGEGPAEFPEDLDARRYLQILNAIRHSVPNALDPVQGLMAQEIEALLELSLWPAVWPGMAESDYPTSGLDLLPSYRLHHILRACQEIKWEFSFDKGSVDVFDLGPRCREVQRQICDHLGWLPPWEIAPRWVDALTRFESTSQDAWCRHYFHHPRSRRTAWAKALLAECGTAPVSGAMLAGSKYYGNIGFPVLIDMSNFERGYVVNLASQWPETDSDFRRMDLLLFAATVSAPNGQDWNWFPRIVQEEATETWLRTPLGSDALE